MLRYLRKIEKKLKKLTTEGTELKNSVSQSLKKEHCETPKKNFVHSVVKKNTFIADTKYLKRIKKKLTTEDTE